MAKHMIPGAIAAMNRREFLATLGTAALAPAMPPPPLDGAIYLSVEQGRYRFHAVQAQRLYNYFRSAEVEAVGMTGRSPFLFPRQTGRLTVGAIRAYGPPSRLPS